MSPTCSRSSLSATPASPGSRWCSGAIALNRCVTHRAPASTAAVACSAVAGVCPSDTITPRSTSAAITSSAPGQVRGDRDERDARVAGPARRSRRASARAAAPRGARRASAATGTAPRGAARAGRAPRHPSGGPAASASSARSIDPVRRGDDRRQPRRHPEPRQQRAELPQPLRLDGQVDAQPPVALQIDEPRRDEEPVELDDVARRRRRRRPSVDDAEVRSDATRRRASTSAPRRITSPTASVSPALRRRSTVTPRP